MKTAHEVISMIEQRKNQRHGLSNFAKFMEVIQNPHKKLQAIHVAGTNGKGSTCNYVNEILQAEGYEVGLFTSPYLENHRDRIRINNKMISEQEFLEISHRQLSLWMAYDLSMFEIDMAIASTYFFEQGCDYCVFEVGLGGRLDATNILEPIGCVITNVSMDHMNLLGTTYSQIAKEKAGIIKPQTCVITAEDKEECLSIFQAVAMDRQADVCMIKSFANVVVDHDSIRFDYRCWKDIYLHTIAQYQVKNAICSLEVLYQLKKRRKLQLDDSSIYEGLREAQWKGRFEKVYEEPMIIVDGAHNEDGVKELCKTLQNIPHVRILFAALEDKDTSSMMQQLINASDEVMVTQFDFYRAQTAQTLAKGFPVQIYEDYRDAIQYAIKDTSKPLIITGSLYFISQVRAYISTL